MKVIAILLGLTGFAAFTISIAERAYYLIIPGLLMLAIALVVDRVAEREKADKIEHAKPSVFKKCAFCAERIQHEATICRYCGKDQPAG